MGDGELLMVFVQVFCASFCAWCEENVVLGRWWSATPMEAHFHPMSEIDLISGPSERIGKSPSLHQNSNTPGTSYI